MTTPETTAAKLPLISLSHYELTDEFVPVAVSESLEQRMREAQEEVATLKEQVRHLRHRLEQTRPKVGWR